MQALLAPEFPGRDALRQQLRAVRVRTIDDEGSLEMQVEGPKADVLVRCPVDGEATDADGVALSAFFHVVDGLASELEILKADGTPIRRMPKPQQWDVVAVG